MCQLPDAVANSDVHDLKKRVERYISPVLRYACRSWHTHLVDRVKTSAYTAEITSSLHRFLEKKLLMWLEVLSVLGTAGSAVDALKASTDYLEVCQGFMLMSCLNLLKVVPEITCTGACPRLLPLRNRILRGYQRILSAHLSLGAPVDTRNIHCTQAICVIRPTPLEGRARGASLMGFTHRVEAMSLRFQAIGCVVVVR